MAIKIMGIQYLRIDVLLSLAEDMNRSENLDGKS